MYACNHETYRDLVGHQVRYVCGKCGMVVWTHPAKYRISWPWAALLLCVAMSWITLMVWAVWMWTRGAA